MGVQRILGATAPNPPGGTVLVCTSITVNHALKWPSMQLLFSKTIKLYYDVCVAQNLQNTAPYNSWLSLVHKKEAHMGCATHAQLSSGHGLLIHTCIHTYFIDYKPHLTFLLWFIMKAVTSQNDSPPSPTLGHMPLSGDSFCLVHT